MQHNTISRLFPVTLGMLFLAAGSSGCEVDTQDACAADDPQCVDEFPDESVDSAGLEWRGAVNVRPDLWGRRFRGPLGDPWMIGRGGYRHRIPDRNTYGNLFGWNDWGNVGFWDGLGGVPVGAPFAHGAYIAGLGGAGCGCAVAVVDACSPCGDVGWYDACDPCGGQLNLVNGGYRYGFSRDIYEEGRFAAGGIQYVGAGGLDQYPGRDWFW